MGRRTPSQVQQQARALGDPTRFAIFQEVAWSAEPVRVAALTERFGLNHNAVRQHLAKLCDAGVVVEETAPRRGPGRPALQYRLAPGARGSWATESPYEQLSVYLLEIARSGRPAREVGVEAGRAAAQAVNDTGADPVELLVGEMARRGFEPWAGEAEVVLDHCPFATAAAFEPGIVCELHRGIVEGFVEAAGDGLAVEDLEVRTPHGAGCRVKLRSSLA